MSVLAAAEAGPDTWLADTASWTERMLAAMLDVLWSLPIGRILLAVALTIGGIFLARLVREWVGRRMKAAAIADDGTIYAASTFSNYLVLALAGLIAVSVAGIDITGLAVVAGALSLGIGFGLQTIINNFVSGLILLFERPVKVGDRVVVEGHDGVVKHIGVRASVIETAVRSVVVLPNSSLVTGAVVNWSRNVVPRMLEVRIPVGPEAEAEQAGRILLEVCRQSARVLPAPEPRVLLGDVTASGLDFVLRVSIRSAEDAGVAGSELRHAALAALKGAGIGRPRQPQDVYLRDLDPFRGIIARAVAQRQQDLGGAMPAPVESALNGESSAAPADDESGAMAAAESGLRPDRE